jgi:hypothetical protein
MPSRVAKFVSAVFVTILASPPFMMMARGDPATTDSCLTSPTGDTPPGSHWRYHTDHINKRNCWFLRRDDGQAQALPQTSAPAPTPAASPPPAKPSIADARAELRGRSNNEDSTATNPPASPVTPSAGAANTSVWNAAPTVATRWPELPPAYQMPKAEPVAASPASNVAQAPADPARAAAHPAPFAYLFLPLRPQTLLALITATLGALAFASAAALMYRRKGRGQRLRRRVAQSARGGLSETTDDDRIILSDYPFPDKADYRPRFARNVRTKAVADDRAKEFPRRAPKYARR